MMQALERAAAVFCTACICAELLSRFVGQGWGQKCICLLYTSPSPRDS